MESFSELINETFLLIIGQVITFLLIFYELRKSRKLEVFNNVYEKLLKHLELIDSANSSFEYLVYKVEHYQKELINRKDETDFMIDRGNDPKPYNVLIEYNEIKTKARENKEFISRQIEEIGFLRNYFSENGKSDKKLKEIEELLKEFKRYRYGELLKVLDHSLYRQTIYNEDYYKLLRKEDGEIDHIKLKNELKLDKIEIMERINYFNKNNFK